MKASKLINTITDIYNIRNWLLDRSETDMQKCPICGRWFKNYRAMRVHKHYCKIKNPVKIIEVID